MRVFVVVGRVVVTSESTFAWMPAEHRRGAVVRRRLRRRWRPGRTARRPHRHSARRCRRRRARSADRARERRARALRARCDRRRRGDRRRASRRRPRRRGGPAAAPRSATKRSRERERGIARKLAARSDRGQPNGRLRHGPCPFRTRPAPAARLRPHSPCPHFSHGSTTRPRRKS